MIILWGSNALGTSYVFFIILGENKIYFIIILLVNKYLKILFQQKKKKNLNFKNREKCKNNIPKFSCILLATKHKNTFLILH